MSATVLDKNRGQIFRLNHAKRLLMVFLQLAEGYLTKYK